MKGKRARKISAAMIPDEDIPTKRTKLIPNARPQRARNASTKSSDERKKIASAKPIPKTPHYQAATQPKQHDIKNMNGANVNMPIGKAVGPTLQENKEQDDQYMYMAERGE